VHEHTFFSSTIKTTILMKIQKTYNEGENNSSRASAFCCGHLTAHFPHWHIKCYDKHKLVYGSSHCNHAILAHPSQLKCSLQTYSRDHNKFPKRQQEFYQYGSVGAERTSPTLLNRVQLASRYHLTSSLPTADYLLTLKQKKISTDMQYLSTRFF
jgi:hypothetical protein